MKTKLSTQIREAIEKDGDFKKHVKRNQYGLNARLYFIEAKRYLKAAKAGRLLIIKRPVQGKDHTKKIKFLECKKSPNPGQAYQFNDFINFLLATGFKPDPVENTYFRQTSFMPEPIETAHYYIVWHLKGLGIISQAEAEEIARIELQTTK